MQFGNRCRPPDLTKSAANASIEGSIRREVKTRVKPYGTDGYALLSRCDCQAAATELPANHTPIWVLRWRVYGEFRFCAILDGLHNFLILLPCSR